jgi:hypothetical protein
MLWEDVKASEEKPEVTHPNRDLPESQTARLGVVLLLVLTIVMLVLVALGGWGTLVGAKALHIGFIFVYVIFAVYVYKWNRGVLPVIAAVAVMLGVFALVAGPAWFARDKTGFSDPALPDALLGMVTLALIPVQMLLVFVSMWGFNQKWNVEEEIKKDGSPVDAPKALRGETPSPPTAAPAS